MYLIDIKRTRVFSLEERVWMQRIGVIFAISCNETRLDDSHVAIPVDDFTQYDVTLKEPISFEDLAKALESLAAKLRETKNEK